jgi:hypothetical protein
VRPSRACRTRPQLSGQLWFATAGEWAGCLESLPAQQSCESHLTMITTMSL